MFEKKSVNYLYKWCAGISKILKSSNLSETTIDCVRSYLVCPAMANSAGILFTESDFVNAFNEKTIKNLRNKFKITIKTVFNDYVKTTFLYKKQKYNGNTVYIFPRFGIMQDALFCHLFHISYTTYTDKFTNTYDDKFVNDKFVNDKLKLHDYQEVAKEYILANVFNGHGNASAICNGTILKMKPGLGKTFTALGIAQELQQKTLVIVHNTNMVAQWKEDIIASGVFKEDEIGEYHSKKKKNGNVVIMIINSAAQIKSYKIKPAVYTPKEWFSQFGLVILDECHKFTAKKFSAVYNRCQSKYMLGLSATPDESRCGLDKVAEVHIGKITDMDKILEEGGLVEITEYKTELNIIEYSGPDRFTKPMISSMGKIAFAPMINQLCEDPYRNRMLVDLLYKYYEEGRDILLFSGRREHLLNLTKMLFKVYKIRAQVPEVDDSADSQINVKKARKVKKETKVLMGGSKLEDIKYAKKHSKIILSTYPWGNTGMSIPKLTTIILATPFRHGAKQTIGRIYRKGGDSKIVRIIMDIVDVRTSLRNQFNTRKKFYKTLNATQHVIESSWKKYSNI